jgi:hypothetical protein
MSRSATGNARQAQIDHCLEAGFDTVTIKVGRSRHPVDYWANLAPLHSLTTVMPCSILFNWRSKDVLEARADERKALFEIDEVYTVVTLELRCISVVLSGLQSERLYGFSRPSLLARAFAESVKKSCGSSDCRTMSISNTALLHYATTCCAIDGGCRLMMQYNV